MDSKPKTLPATIDNTVASSLGTMAKPLARKVMPMKSTASSTAITASVVAAFLDSGGSKAGTPVAMASVPVSATAPEAKARAASSRMATLARSIDVSAMLGIRGAFAADDDLPRTEHDHQQGRAHEEVGGHGEDVAGLPHAAQVGQRDDGHHHDRDGDLPLSEGGHGSHDLLGGRRDRHRHREHVVDEQGRCCDERCPSAQVGLRHRVGPAAGRVGHHHLAVADGHDAEQQGDGDRRPGGPG